MGSRGITWQASQAFHSRFDLERTKTRTSNDFTQLQACLANLEMPECITCLSMLKRYNFDLEELRALLEKASDPDCPSPEIIRMVGLEDENISEPLPINEPDIVGSADISDPSQWQIVPYVEQEFEGDGEDQGDNSKGKGKEEAEEDVFAALRGKPYLRVLQLGSHDRRVPIRCTLCFSAAQREGKIFEAHKLRRKTIATFVKQHCRGSAHIAALARARQRVGAGRLPPLSGPDPQPQQMVPCPGIILTNDERYRKEVLLWARNTVLAKTLGRHSYTFDLSNDTLIVHHQDCLRICAQNEGMDVPTCCEKCMEPQLGQAAVRSAVRFALKHFGARLLEARLFRSKEFEAELLQEFRSSHMYRVQETKSEELIEMSPAELQKWLRQSWLKVPKDCMSETCFGCRAIFYSSVFVRRVLL